MKRKREILNKYSIIIEFFIKISKILPNRFYLFIYKLIMSRNSLFAVFIRYICLKNCAKKCGNNVAIYSNVYLYNMNKLEIGNNVSINPMCYIESSGEVSIGNDVSIAHGSTIMSEEHNFWDVDTNIKDQGCKYIKTVIENNVWIAAGCRILAGSKVKTGTIVAAGAVVKGTVKSNTVVGGIPAKIIKERK